jgi:hypothetical protein
MVLFACVALPGCMVGVEAEAPRRTRRVVTVVPAPSRSDVVLVVPGRPIGADAIAPHWRGEWQTDTGYRCSFELTLAVDDKGIIDGLFRWTLRDAPRDSTQHARIGQVGNEWVRGAFDPSTRRLTLVGYAVDAPDLLVADRYVLTLDPSGSRLVGKSEGEGGRWQDRLSASVVADPASDG